MITIFIGFIFHITQVPVEVAPLHSLLRFTLKSVLGLSQENALWREWNNMENWFTLPVGCKKKKDPKVHLSVIPCESRDLHHVTIEGEFLIPRNCSRHKWLVEYCDCSVCLSVKVINLKNTDVLGDASGEFTIAHSEVNRDHRTHMKLDKVLEHETFLYSDVYVDNFDFHVTVQLFEHECRLDNTVQY